MHAVMCNHDKRLHSCHTEHWVFQGCSAQTAEVMQEHNRVISSFATVFFAIDIAVKVVHPALCCCPFSGLFPRAEHFVSPIGS